MSTHPHPYAFVSESKNPGLHFAVMPGLLTVIFKSSLSPLSGQMSILSFAWLTRAGGVRNHPIIHSLN